MSEKKEFKCIYTTKEIISKSTCEGRIVLVEATSAKWAKTLAERQLKKGGIEPIGLYVVRA